MAIPIIASARLKAYSQVRRWLTLDGSMDPALREELQRRLEILGVNPLEDSVFEETEIAERQYDALLRYAADPNGLPARLDRDRNAEMAARRHGLPARMGLRLAKWSTFGIYSHHELTDSTSLAAAVSRERRAERQIRFLRNRGRIEPAARRGLEHRRGAPRRERSDRDRRPAALGAGGLADHAADQRRGNPGTVRACARRRRRSGGTIKECEPSRSCFCAPFLPLRSPPDQEKSSASSF